MVIGFILFVTGIVESVSGSNDNDKELKKMKRKIASQENKINQLNGNTSNVNDKKEDEAYIKKAIREGQNTATVPREKIIYKNDELKALQDDYNQGLIDRKKYDLKRNRILSIYGSNSKRIIMRNEVIKISDEMREDYNKSENVEININESKNNHQKEKIKMIKELNEMKESGIITDDEFEVMKQDLIKKES